VLDRQEGAVDEVTPDWSTVQPGQRVVALHSHPHPGGPSGEDWDVLCAQVEVGRIEVVDSEAVHIVEKPVPWEFQADATLAAEKSLKLLGQTKWVSILRSLFDRSLAKVRRDPLFAERDEASQIEETNKRLLKQPFLKGFRIRKEALY